MECPTCDANLEMLQIFMDKNDDLELKLIDQQEKIRTLTEKVETLGVRYRDMRWQRNALHNICLNERQTLRYRELSNTE